MVALQDAALSLSGLNLMMTDPDPAGFRIQALTALSSGGFTFGQPEAVIASIQSQLQDGDLERIDRNGNRTAVIPLAIDAPDSTSPGAAVALGEAALDAACTFTGWTELAVVSPLAGAQQTIYEVTSAVWSAISAFSDVDEMMEGVRYATVTIHARPFARGTTPVTIDAPSTVGGTTTTVDDGSSAFAWSLLSTAPAPFHNRLPNPSFETDTSGWDLVGADVGSAVRKTGSLALQGSAYVEITTSISAGQTIFPSIKSPLSVVTPGEQVTVWIANRTLDSSGVSSLNDAHNVEFYSNTSGTAVVGAYTNLADAGPAVSGGWKVTTHTFTVPSGAIRMRIIPGFFVQGRSLGAFKWQVDGGQISEPGATYYVDGNTADTAAVNYSWDGTANTSTSTATWTAPSLGVVSGTVRATVYGRSSAAARRAGTINMATLPYLRVKGTVAMTDGTVPSDAQVTVADNGGAALDTVSYSYNTATGVFEVLVDRPAGFAALDVTATRTGATVSTTAGLYVAVDQVEITDSPFGTGKVQTRQVQILGSQRTELSLAVLGLDGPGTTAQGLGEQVLIHTGAAGSDGRAKFLSARTAAGAAGTSDTTATGGVYTDLPATSAPLSWTFPASALLPGNYMPVLRVRHSAALAAVLSIRAYATAAGQTAYDPRSGWKTAPLTIMSSGATWPQVNVNEWVMVPLPLLRLPPADVSDPAATVTIQIACDSGAVDLDDVFLCNADVGQTSLLLTSTGTSTSFSAVRLDAATVDAAQPSAWFGVANATATGAMLADAARWFGEQHQAAPGLMQIGTVTPGCATSRVSGHYYARNHTNKAPEAA